MKALVLEDYNTLVYKDVPDPEPRPGEVLIKVMACGICGSDIHGFDGSTGRRIPPLIMGHEASGVIAETGRGVEIWKAGDRVTFDSTIFPLNDWYTRQGLYNLSENREVIGVSPGNYRRNGAFAEYVTVPEHVLYRIPENVSFEQAAMVEPASVAMHAVNIAGVKTGNVCVVVGSGMIGTFIVRILKLTGVPEIIAVDIHESRLENARRAGATRVYKADRQDLAGSVGSLSGNRGADISFDAAGMEKSVNTAIEVTRKGGKVVLVGNSSPRIGFPLQKVVTGEMKILGSCAIRGEYEDVLNYIQKGMLSVDEHISAVAPLEEGAEWFSRLKNDPANYEKVILIP